MDFGDFASQIDIKPGNTWKEIHGNRSERIWTKSAKSVLMDLGAFGSKIDVKSESSRKSLRTELDEIVQIRSGGFG